MTRAKPAYLTLLLALLHGIAGLSILVLSSWFIAISAIAPFGFNYVIPAVVIRAFALLRIASGYASMWVGHNDLLGRIARLRLDVFAALKNSHITDKAFTTEALAQHTEELASKWIAWVAPFSAVAFIFASVCVVALWSALPGSIYICLLFVSWLVLIATQALMALNTADLHTHATVQFRRQSSEFLNASTIWHLNRKMTDSVDNRDSLPSNTPVGGASCAPSAQAMWQQQLAQKRNSQRIGWYFQGMSFLAVVLVMSGVLPQGYTLTFAPIAMVVPMVLLAAPDWASAAFNGIAKFAQYKQSDKALKTLNVSPIKPLPDVCVQHSLTLKNLTVKTRRTSPVSACLPATGIIGVTGPSGCGKSSLLQGIVGLLPTNGEREVDGLNLPAGLVANWLYVEQAPVVLSGSVQMNLDPAGDGVSQNAMLHVMSELGLNKILPLTTWVGKAGRPLSGGECKRIALARAVLAKPRVLLVDEPFEGLDVKTQQRVCNVLNHAAKHSLVVIASHVIPAALQVHNILRLGDDQPQTPHKFATLP